jgi:hypothetical protein
MTPFKKILEQFDLTTEEMEVLREAVIVIAESHIKKQYGLEIDITKNPIIRHILGSRQEVYEAYQALVLYMQETTRDFVRQFQEAKKELIDDDE